MDSFNKYVIDTLLKYRMSVINDQVYGHCIIGSKGE